MTDEEWLREVVPVHDRLTKVLCPLIEKLVEAAQLDGYLVEGRTKEFGKIMSKIPKKNEERKRKKKPAYNPRTDLHDISGFRVVTYLESDVAAVARLIEKHFDIDPDNSVTNVKRLKANKMGYRSTHYVCSIGNFREILREYNAYDPQFEGLKFEIQVRTLLQHAWATTAHEPYKDELLPRPLQRRLNLHSSLLELADRGLRQFVRDYGKHKRERALVDSGSLGQLAKNQMSDLGIDFREWKSHDYLFVADEVRQFGAQTTDDVKKWFNKDFIDAIQKHKPRLTPAGLFRSAMMYSDLKKYFDRVLSKFPGYYFGEEWFQVLCSKYGERFLRDEFEKRLINVIG